MNADNQLLIVAIYLRGESLRPDIISELIGAPPTRCQQTGEPSARANIVPAQIGVWCLVAQIEGKLDLQIAELLGSVSQTSLPLDQLPGVEEAYLDIYLGLEDGQSRSASVNLSKLHAQALGALGLEIQFTVN